VNNHDRQNIEFIRSRTPEELTQWLEYIKKSRDEYEIDYAMEMLTAARNQIEMELLALYDADAEEDIALASAYLKRFQLQ
jgi:hypothetical protein